ncbi:sodium:solute symporter family protein [Paraburkholderia phenoliruptrix]|uniref:Solute:Na+ symporter, SSS family n=2 Tax=Paraburkholderia phenoliruptrix TaxID=252970 RepID=K0DJR3_9BURK|nr:sodium:solute symporter family protein [Paraburkholderia phenoliruptrix]AFT86246.1 solute:Na+ symporter, SSS family [Paraburkholderia phenoliruptrix BR3459a]CAB4048804.1 putative symporter YodF [Paraburkholderia phenoliruptrix]
MNSALLILTVFFVGALAIGLVARRGVEMNLEEWSIAGRGFGVVISFVLIAGEIFSTYSFLGATGWAYAKGAPVFYYMGCASLAFVIGYWTLPRLRDIAQEYQLVSFSDYFERVFNSRVLGAMAAVIGLGAMVPLLVIQMKGLGIIVHEASYGGLSETAAIWAGLAIMVAYIVVSGIRGAATVAVVKDVLILIVALSLAVYLPLHYLGGYAHLFETIERTHPGHFNMPETGLNATWYNSTVLLVSLGYYLFPHAFTSVYAIKTRDAARKNAIMMPLYQMLIVCMYIVGFTAIVVVPGLTGSSTDIALFAIAKKSFPAWVVGVIGGAGLLTALVPGAMILLNASTMFSKNVVRGYLLPHASDAVINRIARITVPVYALICVTALFSSGASMVPISLFASNLLDQLFPAFLLGLIPRVTKRVAPLALGIVVGVLMLGYVSLGCAGDFARAFPFLPTWLASVNVGLSALAVNVIVMSTTACLSRVGARSITVAR